MKTNKRRLYESIMKDVSKTIKRNLNEDTYFSDVQGDEFKIDVYVDEDECYYADITTGIPTSGEVETTSFSNYDKQALAEEIGEFIIDLYI